MAVLLGLSLCGGAARAQEVYDVRNHPDHFYLKSTDVVNSLNLLPPPP